MSASAPDLRAVAAAGVVVTFPIVLDMPWNFTYVAPVSWSLGWKSCECENLCFKDKSQAWKTKILANIAMLVVLTFAKYPLWDSFPSYEVTADQCYHLAACHHNLTKPDWWQIAKQFAWEELAKTICVRTRAAESRNLSSSQPRLQAPKTASPLPAFLPVSGRNFTTTHSCGKRTHFAFHPDGELRRAKSSIRLFGFVSPSPLYRLH